MAQAPSGTQDPHALIWIDLEMSGLDTETDRILEVATIITDSALNLLAEGPVLAVHQPASVLDGMDEWNTRTHSETGLIERVRTSVLGEIDVEQQTLEFIQRYVPKNRSPMCGNSVCQDRRFLARCMPELEAWFHYRNLDVSTLKELARRWKPDVYNGLVKKNTHKALDDVRESIEELKHYRTQLLRL
ncbi:MAG: oligoribonuclease [Gammaproteobacteria bacterium]|jgi:oligoribonuclease|nr:oligoribonuclease [Gammaproteobacteria bacterium]